MTTQVTRERLHQLIEELPENTLTTAEQVLVGLADPVLRLLANAPIDDESEMPGEEPGLQDAYDDIANGDVVTHEEAVHQLLGHQ